MTIKWKDGETTWFICQSNVPKLIQFLEKKGFEPQLSASDDRVITVNKELVHNWLTDDWHKFTGYDKILANLLKRYP